MGLLTFFSRPAPSLVGLPAGSFTVDRRGSILVSTVPSSFPTAMVKDIGQQVLSTFQEAATAQLPLSELTVNYPSLKITARELRGGALIFLSPRTPYAPARTQ
jgi:hypothetical protein